MTFVRRLANITGHLVRGFFCPPTRKLLIKALHEITVKNPS